MSASVFKTLPCDLVKDFTPIATPRHRTRPY
jgi:hypothetical protein